MTLRPDPVRQGSSPQKVTYQKIILTVKQINLETGLSDKSKECDLR